MMPILSALVAFELSFTVKGVQGCFLLGEPFGPQLEFQTATGCFIISEHVVPCGTCPALEWKPERNIQ